MKILLAEDETMCQNSIKNFCKKLEIEIDVASNGQEALDFCKSGTTYELILMDNYMPEMNGLQATEKIRGMSHGSSYNIILLSGVEEMSEEEFKKYGFNAFCKKPLSKTVFEALINQYKK